MKHEGFAPGPWPHKHRKDTLTCSCGYNSATELDNTKTALLAILTAAMEGRYSVIGEFAEKALGGKLAAEDYTEGKAVALLARVERLEGLARAIVDHAQTCDSCDGTGKNPRNQHDACRRCGGIGEYAEAGDLIADARAALAIPEQSSGLDAVQRRSRADEKG